MYRRQRGLSMTTFMVGAVILVILALGGMLIGPAYMEYGKIKKAVVAVALEEKATSVAEVRKAFDKRAQIDDIEVISAQDLDVSKEGSEIVISFAYSKKVPLFANISLLIEFSGASNR
jgi:hypothetical protein